MAEARNCSASERSQDRRVPLCRDFARGCSAVNHGREFTARTRAITIANCRLLKRPIERSKRITIGGGRESRPRGAARP